jgi:hypothetical protein
MAQALGMRRVVRVHGWWLRVAVPWQVGDNDGEILREMRRNAMPQHMRLGIAVQQRQRRPVTSHPEYPAAP